MNVKIVTRVISTIIFCTVLINSTSILFAHDGQDHSVFDPPATQNDPTTLHIQDDAYWAELAQDYPAWTPPPEARNQARIPEDDGSWGPILPWPHTPVSAANLPDGRMLTYSSNQLDGFPGGDNATKTFTTVWNPQTGDFNDFLHDDHDMFCAALVMTEDGEVFVNGGNRSNGNHYKVSTFDFTNNNWNRVENMNNQRWYPTTVALPDNGIFTLAGSGGDRYPEIWYEGQGWDLLTGINIQNSILDYAGTSYYYPHWWPLLHVAPSGDVFHSGPTPQMNYFNTSGNGSMRSANASNLWYPKHGSTVMYDEGKLLTAGGANPDQGEVTGNTTNRAMTIDINGSTPVVREVESMRYNRKFANGVLLPTGDVAMIGGTSDGRKFNDSGSIMAVEAWNPDTNRWTTWADASVPRNYHSVALLMTDGRIFSGGGGLCGSTCNGNHRDAQIFTPPYLYDSNGNLAQRPTITAAPPVASASTQINVSATAGIDTFRLIKMSATTHGVNSDLRSLDIPFRETSSGKYRLTMNDNINVMTPGYWMLFAVDQHGVPSVAHVLQISSGSTSTIEGDNVALGKSATQSSTDYGRPAGSATDGDTNGRMRDGSVTHTGLDNNAWLEVDLGNLHDINQITLWNRTDCCIDRLSNFYVFVSDTPFTSKDLGTTKAQAGVSHAYYPDTVGLGTTFDMNRTGRYVRVQLAGQNYLSLAEVEIFGEVTLRVDDITTTPQQTDQSVRYTANATGAQGAALQYKWSFGDGTSATGWRNSTSVNHTYRQPGRYIATLTVRQGSFAEMSIDFPQVVHLPLTADKPTSSMSIAYQTRNSTDRIWNVNPDNDSVTVFNGSTGKRLAEIDVGDQPRSIAIANNRAWVVNKTSATISVIDTGTWQVVDTIELPYASQPHGVLFDPAGLNAYVSLSAIGQVIKLNSQTGEKMETFNVGPEPRHLSMSADGLRLFVSRYITPPLPGESGGSVNVNSGGGEVIMIGTASRSDNQIMVLAHSTQPDAEKTGRGLPNYLGALAISPDGTNGYIPSKQDNMLRGMIRDGNPLTFEHTVRAVTSKVDMETNSAPTSHRIDHDNAGVATAAAYDATGTLLFVTLETNRQVAVIDVHINSEMMRFDVGRAPQGIVVSPDGTKAYIHNFTDRSVTVISLRAFNRGENSIQTIGTWDTVGNETLATDVLLGKQLFYDASDTRLARDSYMSCASCHESGGHDGRVYDFTHLGEGVSNTISLVGHENQGRLHWSGNFDEFHDFEGQIRDFAGGSGLMNTSDFNAGSREIPLGDPKAGVSNDLDALAAYMESLGAETVQSPYRNRDGTYSATDWAGRRIFESESCASCHAGAEFTDSESRALHDIGTLDAASGSRLGGTLAGLDTPTLRGLWASAPYLHDGSAATLTDAINAHDNVSLSASDTEKLAEYLLIIDEYEAFAPGSKPIATAGELANLKSNKCVDVPGISMANGANVHQWTCHGGDHQQWTMIPQRSGFSLQVKHSGYCLQPENKSTNSAANVVQAVCDGSASQSLRWDGESLLFVHSDHCLDIEGGSVQNGGNVQQHACNGTAAQRFRFEGSLTTFDPAAGAIQNPLPAPTSTPMIYARRANVHPVPDSPFNPEMEQVPTNVLLQDGTADHQFGAMMVVALLTTITMITVVHVHRNKRV